MCMCSTHSPRSQPVCVVGGLGQAVTRPTAPRLRRAAPSCDTAPRPRPQSGLLSTLPPHQPEARSPSRDMRHRWRCTSARVRVGGGRRFLRPHAARSPRHAHNAPSRSPPSLGACVMLSSEHHTRPASLVWAHAGKTWEALATHVGSALSACRLRSHFPRSRAHAGSSNGECVPATSARGLVRGREAATGAGAKENVFVSVGQPPLSKGSETTREQ